MPNQVKGVAPGFLLLPAREYEWELVRKLEISIPNKGQLSTLVKANSANEQLKFAGEDSFTVFDDGVLSLWEVIRVMFANVRYPDLKDDECFNVFGVEINENDIVLHGEVIRNV
jgi:hypothetical protein